ncbi:MAG: hypothetical protein ACRDDZ_09090 [Marinifilaceae bacterium]
MKNEHSIKPDLLRTMSKLPLLGITCMLSAFSTPSFGNKTTHSHLPINTTNEISCQTYQEKQQIEDSVFHGMTEKQKAIYKQFLSPNAKAPEKGLEHQILREDQIVVSNMQFCNRYNIKNIEIDENETRVTRVEWIGWDRQWVQFRKGYCIIDTDTDKEYRLRGVTRGIELNKVLWVHEKKGRFIEFTMIFDPLDPNVKTISFEERYREEGGSTPPNSVQEKPWKNITVSEYLPKENEVIYNYLLDEQTPTIKLDKDVNQYKLLSVIRDDNETKVTFAVNIENDFQPILFSKGYAIRDAMTKEKYFIKRIENDIPLDKVNVVRDKNNQYVTFTMVFPAIPMSTKFIDILQVPTDNEIAVPENIPTICWFDIFVEYNRFPYNTPNTISNNQSSHPENCLTTVIDKNKKLPMELNIYNKGLTELTITLPKSGKYIIPETFAIQDCYSGKKYPIKKMDTYCINQKFSAKKQQQITLYFDCLPYGIDKVNIGCEDVSKNLILENVQLNN